MKSAILLSFALLWAAEAPSPMAKVAAIYNQNREINLLYKRIAATLEPGPAAQFKKDLQREGLLNGLFPEAQVAGDKISVLFRGQKFVAQDFEFDRMSLVVNGKTLVYNFDKNYYQNLVEWSRILNERPQAYFFRFLVPEAQAQAPSLGVMAMGAMVVGSIFDAAVRSAYSEELKVSAELLASSERICRSEKSEVPAQEYPLKTNLRIFFAQAKEMSQCKDKYMYSFFTVFSVKGDSLRSYCDRIASVESCLKGLRPQTKAYSQVVENLEKIPFRALHRSLTNPSAASLEKLRETDGAK